MSLTTIQKVRLEVGDTSTELPILADSSYEYFLEKHNDSISRAALDAAKSLLFVMSTRGDEVVDILSISGSKAANAYREALKMYIKDQNLNPVFSLADIYAGGISVSEMQLNIDDADNNYVNPPNSQQVTLVDNVFEV